MECYSTKDILKMLLSACQDLNPKGRKRGGQKIWAEKNGISPQYLNEVLNGKKPLLEHVAQKLNKDFFFVGGWIKRPKHMRKRRNWTFKEIMEDVNYKDN